MVFWKEKSGRQYPSVPPSLNHDSFELQDSKRDYLAQPSHDSAGSITPYLGLRARLSQIWINRWTVLLLLVLVRVLILIATLNDDIGTAKTKALSACTKVEDIGSAMASMPHYLSVGVNKLAGVGVTKAVHGLVTILMMILTGVEELILFIVNMFVGTYICLTTALIHGGLDVGIGAANAVTDVMNKGIAGITDSLANDVKSVQDAINSIVDKVNSGTALFGGHIDPPTIDISGHINDLKNIKVDDTDFVKTLAVINDKIPTYDEVQTAAKSALSIPFDMVKNALNNSYGGYTFDDSIFPVAQKQSLSFCSNNSKINDFFEHLYEIARTAKITFMVVLIILAILVCVPMTFLEIKKFQRQRRHAKLLHKHGYDSMDVVYIASRSTTSRVGLKFSSFFSGKRALLARWAVAYGTSTPALFVLSLALAGFFSCLCQWILLRVIQQEAPALAQEVGDFAGEVVTTLEGVSDRWAGDANNVILSFQNDVNNDVLGYVTNATAAVNGTLNTFTDEINKGITAVFGGTVLDKAVQDIVRCLVGLKVEAVEKGLTWVHDHAHITLPLFANDTFSIGAAKSIQADSDLTSFLASPSSVTTDEVTDALDHVLNFLHSNIVQEALISTGLLLVYIIVVLLGVVRAAMGMATPDRTRGDGGQRFYTGDGQLRTPPASPRRTKSETSIRAPADVVAASSGAKGRDPFGDDSGYYADDAASGGLKEKPRAVRSGKGTYSPGHVRGSSYGHVEDADGITPRI